MRIHRNSYIAVISLLLGLFLFGKADACSYAFSPSPPMEYIASRTETIFLGKVIDKKTRIEKIDGERTKVISITFKIERLIKGKLAKDYRIDYYHYISRRDSCYYPPPNPKYSENWVVFDGYDQGNDDISFIGPDHLSWKNESNEHHKKWLQEIDAAVKNQTKTFYGEVELAYSGLPPLGQADFRADLWSTDSQTPIKSVQIHQGRFQIDNFEAGSYILRLHSLSEGSFIHPENKDTKLNADGRFSAEFKITLSSSYPEYKFFAFYGQKPSGELFPFH